jgi:quercetin dioxygenase-like cupin family protein
MSLVRLKLGAAVLAAVTLIACSDRAGSRITGQAAGQIAAGPDSSDDVSRDVRGNDQVIWGPAPPIFPPGAQFAVVEGDPGKAGAIFTVRLRFPNGYVLPPHFHPADEYVTVLAGTFLAGMGEHFSREALVPYRVGGFATMPGNMPHFASVHGMTEVQVHGMGPFALTYVNPADDPTK